MKSPIIRGEDQDPESYIGILLKTKELIETLGTEEDLSNFCRGEERFNYLIFLTEIKESLQRAIDRFVVTMGKWDLQGFNVDMWVDNKGKLDEARRFDKKFDVPKGKNK